MSFLRGLFQGVQPLGGNIAETILMRRKMAKEKTKEKRDLLLHKLGLGLQSESPEVPESMAGQSEFEPYWDFLSGKAKVLREKAAASKRTEELAGARWDERRGVFVSPSGKIIRPEGLPEPILTETEKRAKVERERIEKGFPSEPSAPKEPDRPTAAPISGAPGYYMQMINEVPTVVRAKGAEILPVKAEILPVKTVEKPLSSTIQMDIAKLKTMNESAANLISMMDPKNPENIRSYMGIGRGTGMRTVDWLSGGALTPAPVVDFMSRADKLVEDGLRRVSGAALSENDLNTWKRRILGSLSTDPDTFMIRLNNFINSNETLIGHLQSGGSDTDRPLTQEEIDLIEKAQSGTDPEAEGLVRKLRLLER